mmetsp:Transcript_52244/g.76519  ORF Transcript_52244/g.76519 Transcript_52244/m.76519 type:complete len:80 (-) Transcript_52244:57-296(-)
MNVLFEIMECNFFLYKRVSYIASKINSTRQGVCVWNENLFVIRPDLRHTIGSITHTHTHTHTHAHAQHTNGHAHAGAHT